MIRALSGVVMNDAEPVRRHNVYGGFHQSVEFPVTGSFVINIWFLTGIRARQPESTDSFPESLFERQIGKTELEFRRRIP